MTCHMIEPGIYAIADTESEVERMAYRLRLQPVLPLDHPIIVLDLQLSDLIGPNGWR